MESFLIGTGILAVIFIFLHYVFNKNDKSSFLSVLFGAIIAAVIAMVILKVAFRESIGVGTEEGAIKE